MLEGLSRRRPTGLVYAAVVVFLLVGASGCVREVRSDIEQPWREYPGYESVTAKCGLIIAKDVQAYVLDAKSGPYTLRFEFGESLVTCLPGALLKVFDSVVMVSPDAPVPDGVVTLKVTKAVGHVRVPEDEQPGAMVRLTIHVEIQGPGMVRPAVVVVGGHGGFSERVDKTTWAVAAMNLAIEGVGNTLTKGVSGSRAALMAGRRY